MEVEKNYKILSDSTREIIKLYLKDYIKTINGLIEYLYIKHPEITEIDGKIETERLSYIRPELFKYIRFNFVLYGQKKVIRFDLDKERELFDKVDFETD